MAVAKFLDDPCPRCGTPKVTVNPAWLRWVRKAAGLQVWELLGLTRYRHESIIYQVEGGFRPCQRALREVYESVEHRMNHDPVAKSHFEDHAKGHKKAVDSVSGPAEKAKAILKSRAQQLREIGDVMIAAEHEAIDVKYADWCKGIEEALKADLALLEG